MTDVRSGAQTSRSTSRGAVRQADGRYPKHRQIDRQRCMCRKRQMDEQRRGKVERGEGQGARNARIDRR